MPSNSTQITPPRVSIIDERTNAVSREWYRWFYNLYTITGEGLGVTPVINGGTGLSTIPTNGQLLIGNGTGYTLNTLTASSGITVTNAAGTITVANSGVLSNVAGTGITVSSATGNVTVAIDDTVATLTGVQTLQNKTLDNTNTVTLKDTLFTLQDNADTTKQAQFQLSAITTATTSTYTLPAATTTLAGLGTTQTFSGNNTFSGNMSLTSSSFTRTATTQNWLDGSMTTATWIVGGTTQTGAITLGRSTGVQTLNLATGATTAATTKTINIGTTGVSTSVTNITSGSAVAGALVTHTWNAGSNSMTLNSSGNVAIGGVVPASNPKLSLYGGIRFLSTEAATATYTGIGSITIDMVSISCAGTEHVRVENTGAVLAISAAGLGYGAGAGGTVIQGTSRTTGVTLNKPTGAITMFSAAGSAIADTFTVTNTLVAATDTIILNQKSGTNLYVLLVTAVAAGSFNITFYTTGGVATDAPVINFSVIKGVTA